MFRRCAASSANASFTGAITALTGSIAGVLTIGTSGEIRQGTGTLGTDYTGLRVWRDSGIGRIGGYASNTLQWYAGTDGRLYAGGGVVSLNQYGYMIAAADFSSGGTWPFVFAGLHAVADVASPTANYRGSLMFGQPLGVFADTPRVWHFHYPGTLPQATPTGGGASKDYAITISDDNESWAVWHAGNDGSGSGLDADLLDGLHAASFLRADATWGAWTALAFASGWSNHGGGYQNCQYRKYGDVVALRGLALSSSTSTTIATLPSGYRPSATRLYIAWVYLPSGGAAARRLNISTSGVITAVDWTPASGAVVSFDEIVFSL